MKRGVVILACMVALASHGAAQVNQAVHVQFHLDPAASPADAAGGNGAGPAPGTLRWTNTEAMTGDLVGATGTSATWKSPMFEAPVVLDWNVIRRMEWPGATSGLPDDPFVFILRDGSSIHGDLVAITGSSVLVHGARFGDVELKRSQVLSARRTNGEALLLAGPTGDAGWHAMEFQPNRAASGANPDKGALPGFTTGTGGALRLPYWNRAAALDVNIKDPVDVEFHLHSSGRPNFRLSIDAGPGTALRIETWGDALVAALPNETDFQLIRKIYDSERDIALRFCWDWKARHCMVFDPAGDLLTDWQAPADDSAFAAGLALQNKGSDLTLDYLRIRKWDGKPPAKRDPNVPRGELADGQIFAGAVKTGTDGSIRLSGSGGEEATTLPLRNVEALYFSTDAPTDGTSAETLTYADGTYLNGRITAIKDGGVTLETAFSTQPLVASVVGLKQLYVNSSPDAPAAQTLTNMDRINIQRTVMHGTLVAAGDASPRWLPVGGQAAVPISKTIPYEIIRSIPDDSPITPAPALFFTRMGDVLPGNMHALDRTGVEFDSGITQTTRLPAAELEAILFGPAGRLSLHGFTGPEWRILKGDDTSVRRTGDSIGMDPGTVIGHPDAMHGKDIRFGLEASGINETVRLRMFCSGTDPAKSSNLLIIPEGSEIIVGEEGANGKISSEFAASLPNPAVAVHLAIRDNEVAVYLNGVSVCSIAAPAEARAGYGLIIEPASVFGNVSKSIRISDFTISSQPGVAWLPNIAADAKTEALTVPRFRRDDPPAHALIAANGDILRGEIEGATTANFGFRSGMDELVVPRDRVKAVIWLGKPVAATPVAPESPTEKLLAQTMQMRMGFGPGQNLRFYTSWLSAQFPGLKFELPQEEATEERELALGGESVAAMIEKICAAYGLSYTVNDKGVIVLAPADAAASDEGTLVDRVYWLKPGSLPGDAPAAKTLVAKGIPFPAGATATWQADSGQLEMRNTAANQALLAQRLATDFGGIVGAPTHWLVLASGARIGLAVDNFGKDVITGWNPSYGRYSIPTADVAQIRTFPLPESPAMKAVEDWHTVYAPEPVLPEAGGDAAASIGEPAGEFKLALLGGGKFDLAGQQGKVVVLDFWATWCGPCVRSLPELIQAMSGFSPDRVMFIGVNEDEPADVVKQFLETRGWSLNVALDDGQHVGQKYGVDAIPHTVIIGQDGKVAWVKTGYTPDGETDVAKEVKQLLAAPAADDSGGKVQ